MLLTVLHLEIKHWLWVKFGWQGRTTGSRGPGRGPSLGEYRSGGTGGSHPGIGNFSRPVSSVLEPLLWSKVQLMGGKLEGKVQHKQKTEYNEEHVLD